MKTSMITPALTLFSLSGLVASTGIALAAVSVGDTLGTTEDEIRAALTAEGYTVEEFETEDGELEAEVTLDGKQMEVVVDAKSGAILEIEMEDADGDDEKDDD